MEKLNPKSPEEWQQTQAEASFLNRDQPAPAVSQENQHHSPFSSPMFQVAQPKADEGLVCL
jgi:hypothetical protein